MNSYGAFTSSKANADCLVLAGDIGEFVEYEYFVPFFDTVSKKYPHVVMILGNHEFYSDRSFDSTRESLPKFISQWDNIVVLDNSSVVIDGVVFDGTTLWTDFNKGDPMVMLNARAVMNDYQHIRTEYSKLTPEDVLEEFKLGFRFLHDSLNEIHPDEDHIVVTHHLPSFRSIPLWFRDAIQDNYLYASDLDEFIVNNTSRIPLWVHGHTHNRCCYTIKETCVLCNPGGYPHENNEFKVTVAEF